MSRRAWRQSPAVFTEDTLFIAGVQVMQRWETPIMRFLARTVTAAGGKILEVGFGMGIAADYIAKYGCAHHTIIEAHPHVAARARAWAARAPHAVTVHEAFWEDWVRVASRERYDGILFDTSPTTEAERDVWYREFIPIAAKLLRPGGVFTYYSNEGHDFSPCHRALLRKHFTDVRFVPITSLAPRRCEYWHRDHIVIPVARRGACDRR